MENLCRLCGIKCDFMFCVFHDFYEDRYLHSKIVNVLRIEIDPKDALPKKICKDCHQRLDDASNFIDFCQNTQHRLEELIRDTSLDLPPIKQTEDNSQGSNGSILSSFQVSSNDHHQDPLLPDANLTTNPSVTQETSQNRVNPSIVTVEETVQIDENSIKFNIEDEKDNETQTANVGMENETKRNNFSCDTITCEISKQDLVERLRENLRQSLLKPQKISKTVRIAKKTRKEKEKKNRNNSEYLSGTKSTLGENKEWICQVCQMKFTQETLYTEHLNVHIKERLKLLCSNSFRQRQELNQYIRTIHSEKKFKCTTCSFSARFESKLAEHVRIVHDKPFKCSLCTYRAGVKKRIREHIASIHNGDRCNVCEICDLGFGSRSALVAHRKNIHFLHFLEKKLCLQCGIGNSSSSHRSVCGKQYTCEHCGKTYRSKASLKGHIGTHLNVKPFECDVCGEDFCKQIELYRHRNVHREAIYQCDICSRTFATKNTVRKHIKKNLCQPKKYDVAAIFVKTFV